jgi:hypothetical protein
MKGEYATMVAPPFDCGHHLPNILDLREFARLFVAVPEFDSNDWSGGCMRLDHARQAHARTGRAGLVCF